MMTTMRHTSQVLAGARAFIRVGVNGWHPVAAPATGAATTTGAATGGFAAESAKHGGTTGTTVRLLRTRST